MLEAAARVLIAEGYERATTNRIARTAGVGIGSLYEFFPNKDAIFTELRRRLNDQMLAVVGSTMEDVMERPVPEAVRQTVEVLIRAHSVNPRLDAALKEQVPDYALADQQHKIRQGLAALGMEFARRHRKELRPRNLELAVFIATQAAESLTHEAAKHLPHTLHDGSLLDEVSDLITRYLVDS